MNVKSFSDVRSLFFDNRTIKQTIFKNTFWLGLGIGLNRLLKLILLVYATRILQATEYGKFTFAFAFVSLFVVFNDLGLSTIVTREFAGEKEAKGEFHSIVSLKLLLTVAAFILIVSTSFFITQDPGIRKVILILGLFTLINGLSSLFYAFFQARQRMEYETFVEILEAVLVTCFGLFVLLRAPSVINLSYSYLAASLIALLFNIMLFCWKFFRIKVFWEKPVWKKFLMMSWPLALTTLFGTFYSYIDSVMMGHWGMITETGWYNAAQRLNFTVFYIVGLICSSFYPVLSKFFKESKEELQKIWSYEIQLITVLFFFLVGAGIVLAPKIIAFFYGAGFLPSVLAFQILMLMVGFALYNAAFNHLLISAGQERKTFWIFLGGALVNIILNIILIPKFSLYGAAITTVISYFLVFGVSLKISSKTASINIFGKEAMITMFFSLISGFSMCCLMLRPQLYNLNLFLVGFIGAAIYAFVFFLLIKIRQSFSHVFLKK